MKRTLVSVFVFALVINGGPAASAADCEKLSEIRGYIQRSWSILRRSNASLLRSTADSKVKKPNHTSIYIPRDQAPDKVRRQLRRTLPAADFQRIEVRPLPKDPASIRDAGLLYLPHPYVVPGGRFNEMYGWDSYFIVLGLVRDRQLNLATGMAQNLLYEVDHYGKVLNANRTYYLSRSQPPLLTETVLEVFRRTGDVRWLERAVATIEKYHDYWTSEPHLTPQTRLSRYYSSDSTPAPEVVYGERDRSGKNHYDRVLEYYGSHPVPEYDLSLYYDRKTSSLTSLFYVGDRAMRESGFDPSARFGPFSVDIINYNPVDLNCLLYRMEMDISAILILLDRPREARLWVAQAEQRATRINEFMWNNESGLYFDYNFERKRQSDYRFITTFYPLWAGLASPDQAAKIASNLSIFERAGGLQTSDRITGDQWDAPFGWAPMQVIAIEGLRRYGFEQAAERLSIKFLSMVLQDFVRHGTIREKYDVVQAKSDLASGLRFGYESNEIGFGWTNAAFVFLYDRLSASGKDRLKHSCLETFAGS